MRVYKVTHVTIFRAGFIGLTAATALLLNAHGAAAQAVAVLAAVVDTAVATGVATTAPSLSADAPAGEVVDLVAVKTPAMRQDDADLWQRIRRGFAMEPMISPLVEQREQWYAERQDYIRRFVERGSKYMYHIVEELEHRNMPTEIVLLPIIESAFNPQAYSRANASGMWQFIPSTGKNFGLKQDWLADHRRDVLLSTDAALDYLQKLHGMFNSWELAFAAYNCGEGCVGRAIATNQRKGLPTDFLNLKLPRETRSYVPKLIAVKNIVLSPATYGIELNSVLNQPYFIKVAAPEKIDVKLAARLAEMPEADFSALNPAFNKPVAANTSYFLVPTEQAEVFKTNLDLYRSLNGPMVSWQAVTAKRGESIERIAKRYGMTGSYLRATNLGVKERRGKLTQPATFMVPMSNEAKIIDATLDRKEELRVNTNAGANNDANAGAIPSANASASVAVPAAVATTAPVAPILVADSLAVAPVMIGTAAIANTYQVQAGDTLFAIAKRFAITVDALKQQNQMHNSQLQSGQILQLPPGSMAAVHLPQTTIATTSVTIARVSEPPRLAVNVSARAKSYTVKSGDTLFGIAQKFDISISRLLQWNKLTMKTVIRPGARLRVS